MKRAFPVAFAALVAALGLVGVWLLFTTFRTYDDEGYVLYSLANFSRDGGLYTHVYSQYGPFFFLSADLAHRLFGFEFTNTAGRLITLFHWLGAATLCGHLIWRYTRSAAWSLFALSATFSHLWQMTSEPGHPGGFITFVVALGAWAGAEFVARESSRGLAIVCGLIGAALVLTKINVGALFIAGAGAWLLLYSAGPRASRIAPWLAALGLVALPWALMRALLPEEWIVTFAVVVGAAGLSVLLAIRGGRPISRESPTPFNSSDSSVWFTPAGWFWCIGSGLAALAVVVIAIWLRGTTPAELLEGVLLAPLRHPGVYSFGVRWRPAAGLFAVGSLLLCFLTVRSHLRRRTWFPATLAALRLALVAVAAMSWIGWLPLNPLAMTISYGLSVAWIFVLPLTEDEAAHRSARVRAWISLLVVTQSLHAYPVGGSQIGWGTFLWAPLAALAAAEATTFLGIKFARFLAPLALAATCAIAVSIGRLGSFLWDGGDPLSLPGAEYLRLPPSQATELRTFTVNATAHTDLLFSLPGMFSFNLWTGIPSPTSANVTHWFNLLSVAQQAEIIAKLEAHPRAGIIVEQVILQMVLDDGIPVRGPLRDYLYEKFSPAFIAGSHEFWVRRGRAIAALSTGHVQHRAGEGTGERVRLELCVTPTVAGRRVTQVEWWEPGQLRATFTAANSRAELEPLRIDGLSIASARPGWDAPLPPIAKLVLYTDAPAALPAPAYHGYFRLRDATGAVIAEAILRN